MIFCARASYCREYMWLRLHCAELVKKKMLLPTYKSEMRDSFTISSVHHLAFLFRFLRVLFQASLHSTS